MKAKRHEHPTLFSTEMVRAILRGRKTQTRRIVSPRTSLVDGVTGFPWRELDFHQAHRDPGPSPAGNPGPYLRVARPGTEQSRHRVYPRVQPGDLLWVRETYALIWPDEGEPEDPRDCNIEYRADKPDARYPGDWPDCPASERDSACPHWRPSIHMPRWACRLLLEVTAVRVEHLQEITESDALAEGVGDPITRDCKVPRFRELWDSLNAERAPWVSNPYVWVIEFRRFEQSAAAEATG